MPIAVTALVIAFLLSYFVTPIVRQLAVRFDFVDRPDGRRKIQAQAVSLGGGVSLVICTFAVVLLACALWGPDLIFMTARRLSLIGLAVASLLVAIVGVLDDGRGIRGSYKLLWQVIAASLVMGTGFSVPSIILLGVHIPLGMLGSAFTVIWLLGAINSFNLIDGVDGLAGTVGVIFSATLGIMALMSYQYLDAIIAFALAGALLGFLRYNYAPATIYLGDAGSMFIGLVLGTIALRCSMKQAASLAFAVPIAIWAIPMFDSLAAVMRRKLTGRSIYATDRGHIHHVLLTRGLNATQAVGLIGALCLVTSAGAVLSLYYEKEWIGIASVLSVIALLIFTRMFGHVELLLLNKRLFGLGRFVSPFASDENVSQTSVNLQGDRSWEDLWGALVESAERFHLVKMRLNLAMPKLHEDFFATWKRAGNHHRDLLWQVDIPLVVDGLPVGRLSVTGLQNADSASGEMSQFIDFVESLESQLRSIIQHELAEHESTEVKDEPEDEAVTPNPMS